MKAIGPTSDPAKSNAAPLNARRFLREFKHRWWIVAVTVVLFGVLGRFVLPNHDDNLETFRSRMWVSGKIQLDENSPFREDFQDYYGTQMELMQCESNQSRAREAVHAQLPNVPEVPVSLSVSLAPRGAVIVLTAAGTNAQYVQAYLDAVMDSYLEYKREMRGQAAELTVNSISRELNRLDGESERAQARLNAFRRTNSVAELLDQGSTTGSYLAELNRKLADLNMKNQFLALLASNQVVDRQLITDTDGGQATDGTTPANGEAYQAAMREIDRLKAERTRLSENLRPKHPAMIRLEDEIRAQEELVQFARQQSREELTNAQAALSLQIKNTETTIRDWEERALTESAAMAEYDHLKQDVERADRQHDYLLSTVRNVDLNKNLDQEALAVMDHAAYIPPRLGVRVPRGLLGGCAGLFTGVGLLLLLMLTSDRVASAEELEGRLSVPVIGQIPDMNRLKGASMPLLLEAGDDRHCFAESLKSIRSALFYSTVGGRRPKSLLVTSALPGEGKSTVAVNLAMTFAGSGYRVLLVDADLRCGVLPELLGARSEPGLADVLKDGKSLADAIVTTRIPNLSFLPPGRRVNNPGELFLSVEADEFLAQVYRDYDYVVIDSVPVLAADDTTSLAPKVEGIVFVVRGSFTGTRSAQRALEMLHDRQGCVLGAVCNRGADDVPNYNYYAKGRNGANYSLALPQGKRM